MSERDPTDTDEVDHEQIQDKRRLRNAQIVEADDIKWLMEQKRGRRILWRQLDRCGVFRSVFNTNAMQMSFNEGNRNEGLTMLNMIVSLAPEKYLEMLKEHSNVTGTDGR